MDIFKEPNYVEEYGGIGRFDYPGRSKIDISWFYIHNADTIWNAINDRYSPQELHSTGEAIIDKVDNTVHIGADGNEYTMDSSDSFWHDLDYKYVISVSYHVKNLYDIIIGSKQLIQESLEFLAEQNLLPIIHAYCNEKIMVLKINGNMV